MLRYLWQQIVVLPNSNVQAESPDEGLCVETGSLYLNSPHSQTVVADPLGNPQQ